MNSIKCPLRLFQRNTLFAGLLALLLFSTRVILADDENLALAAFNQAVQTADPARIRAAYEKDHSKAPSKQEVYGFVATLTGAAISVMDQAGEFAKRFPQSKQLAGNRASLIETLAHVFGSLGLPVPPKRAVDLEVCVRSLMRESPDDVRLYMILCRVAAALPSARQRAIFEELSGESTPGPARHMAQNALLELKRAGLPLDLGFTALDGRQFNLAELKGKVVLVDFWATTCVPCVRDLPDLKKLYTKYNARGLEIVGISLDADKAALTHFIEKERIPWPQYYDPAGATNRLAKMYDINSIPVVWLVDRHGVLRQLNARDDQEKKVEALLKE